MLAVINPADEGHQSDDCDSGSDSLESNLDEKELERLLPCDK